MKAFIVTLSVLMTSMWPASAQLVRGDYLEARTCSVYAGGCHYSGEYVTAGREALVFWYIREGKWNGVEIGGLSVLAAVVADDNLAEPSARRKSVLYVDQQASKAQQQAIAALFATRYAHLLGAVQSVKAAPIRYVRQDRDIQMEAPGVAFLHITRYPCKHCVQPHQVWYQPLAPIKTAEVAAAKLAVYRDRQLGTVWQRGEENSVFVGEFILR